MSMKVYVHIAIFRWKAEAASEEVDGALLAIEGLASKVPGIIEIAVGSNGSRYNEGYSHVVLVRGESAAAIDAYRKHPEHEEAARVIERMEDHGIGVDFVTGELVERVRRSG